MAATKDQRKLLNRCVMNEIPVFVLTGTDRCAMAALRVMLFTSIGRKGANLWIPRNEKAVSRPW